MQDGTELGELGTYTDRAGVENAIRTLVPQGRWLAGLSREADGVDPDRATIWVDETADRVLWGFREYYEDPWTLEAYDLIGGADALNEVTLYVRNRLSRPAGYATGGDVDADLATLDELYAIYLASPPHRSGGGPFLCWKLARAQKAWEEFSPLEPFLVDYNGPLPYEYERAQQRWIDCHTLYALHLGTKARLATEEEAHVLAETRRREEIRAAAQNARAAAGR